MKTLNLALESWLTNLKDPGKNDHSVDAERCRAAILHMIQDGGLGWQGWVKTYTGDGAFAWCGAFVAYCMPDVKPELRKKWWASTYRLFEYGNKNPGRQVRISDIQPGDIVCVGDGNYGAHITIAMIWDATKSTLVTVSGNGMGRLPDGSWGEGVVINVYGRHSIKAAYRPIKEDLCTSG